MELSEKQRESLDQAIRWWEEFGGPLIDDLVAPVAHMIADAEQRAYARGVAEQAAKVEAVLTRMSARTVDHRHPDEDGSASSFGISGRAYYYAGDVIDDIYDLRAALAPEGTDALAKVRADALREWIGEWPADADDGTFLGDVARDGLERTDRIEAGDAQ